MTTRQTIPKSSQDSNYGHTPKSQCTNTSRLHEAQMNFKTCYTTTSISSNTCSISNYQSDEKQGRPENMLKGQARVFVISTERDQQTKKRSDSQKDKKIESQTISTDDSKRNELQQFAKHLRVESQSSQKNQSQLIHLFDSQLSSRRTSQQNMRVDSEQSMESQGKCQNRLASQENVRESSTLGTQYSYEQVPGEQKRYKSNSRRDTSNQRGESGGKRVEWRDQVPQQNDQVRMNGFEKQSYQAFEKRSSIQQNVPISFQSIPSQQLLLPSKISNAKKQPAIQEWKGLSEGMKQQLRKYLRECGVFEEGTNLDEGIINGSVLAKIVLKETGESLQGVFLNPKNKSQVNVTFCSVLTCFRKQSSLNQRFLAQAEGIKTGDISTFWNLLYDIFMWSKENKGNNSRQKATSSQQKQDQQLSKQSKVTTQSNKQNDVLINETSYPERTKVIISSRPMSSPIKGILRRSNSKLQIDSQTQLNKQNDITNQTHQPEQFLKLQPCESSPQLTQHTQSSLNHLEQKVSPSIFQVQHRAYARDQSPLSLSQPIISESSQHSTQTKTQSSLPVSQSKIQHSLPTSSSFLRIKSNLSTSQPQLQILGPKSNSQSSLFEICPQREQSKKFNGQVLAAFFPTQQYSQTPQEYIKKGDFYEQQIEIVQKKMDELFLGAQASSSVEKYPKSDKKQDLNSKFQTQKQAKNNSKRISIETNQIFQPNQYHSNSQAQQINNQVTHTSRNSSEKKIKGGINSERNSGREKFINQGQGVFNFSDHFLMKGTGSVAQIALASMSVSETPKRKLDNAGIQDQNSSLKTSNSPEKNAHLQTSPFKHVTSQFKNAGRQENNEARQVHLKDEFHKKQETDSSKKQLAIDTIQKQFTQENSDAKPFNQQSNIINSLFKKYQVKHKQSNDEYFLNTQNFTKDELLQKQQQPHQKDESQSRSNGSTKETFYSNASKKLHDSFMGENNQISLEEIFKLLNKLGCGDILKSIDFSKEQIQDFSSGVIFLRLLEKLEGRRLKYFHRPISKQECSENIQLVFMILRSNSQIDQRLLLSEDPLIKGDIQFILLFLSAILKAFAFNSTFNFTFNSQQKKSSESLINKEYKPNSLNTNIQSKKQEPRSFPTPKQSELHK